MKRAFLLLTVCALVLAACASPAEETSPDDYTLYYAALLDGSDGGDAIRASTVRIADSAALTTPALAEALVRELLTAPEDEDLRSPFPSGTELQKLTVAGGRATVDLSAQYARLSGVDLSLADYCLTLTLTQLTGIYAVRITANGRELPYRKTQLLTAADPLLSSGEDVIRPIDVSLWFLDTGTGELRAQQQTLALYEGQSRVSVVLAALGRGPEGDDALQALLTSDLEAVSSRIDEGVCYVNLNARVTLPKDPALRELALESIARSLTSLSGVEGAQVLIDGEIVYDAASAALAAESAEALET